MKKFLITTMLALSSLTMVVADADAARRLGGGSSIGRQSSNVTRQAPAPSQPAHNQAVNPSQARPATPNAPAAPAVRPPSPWRNILGGALLGLGLGALLSHFGIGGGLASMISSILMIALLVFAAMFIYRMLRRKNGSSSSSSGFNARTQSAYAGYGGNDAGGSGTVRAPEIGSRLDASSRPSAFQADTQMSGSRDSAAYAGHQPWGVPADMDVNGFLRNAKTYFIRLQAAWDKADINDLREFTTPEMYAELRMQLQERGPSPSHTDVTRLDAQLLGVETVNDQYLASVRFSGAIKEAENAQPEPFVEVWNLTKPVSGQGGWVLAGIQQLSEAGGIH
jgi:predicted lipid-binding transport protein (Tim44 family)